MEISVKPDSRKQQEREDLFRVLRERIFRTLCRTIRPDRAEDFAQDVIAILLKKYPHLHEAKDLVPLAFAVMRRIPTWREAKEAQPPEEGFDIADTVAPNPEQALLKSERAVRLKSAIALLGKRCRKITRMRLEGRGIPDLAAEFQVTRALVSVWSNRCFAKLRTILNATAPPLEANHAK